MSDLEKIRFHYNNFLKGFRSLSLASTDSLGWPHISYAPFIEDSRRQFYVYLSDLAGHTDCLRESGKASVLFIEDESQAVQIFARTRVVFQCEVTQVSPESDLWHSQMEDMSKRFGELISTLRSLSDFHLFQLKPVRGSFVMDFGKAFTISGSRMDQLKHLSTKKND